MKNLFIVFMNVLFLLVVAADVVAVKYDCDTAPVVQKSCYQERQAQTQYSNIAQTTYNYNM